MNPQLVARLHRELTPEQVNLVRECLGFVPTDELQGDYSDLWKRYVAGEVGFAFFPGSTLDDVLAFTFYGVEILSNGKRDFVSFASFAPNNKAFDYTLTGIPQLEQFARAANCDSISLRTIRAGLVSKLTGLGWFPSEITCRKIL